MLAIRLSFLLAALTLGASSVLSACSSSNQCPKSKPCCSQFGFCGSTADHCLSGCDPLGSFKHGSCAPMPRCQDQDLDFTNSKTHYVSASKYKGDADSSPPLTLEGGSPRPSNTGLKLTVGKGGGSGGSGTSLSTTRYMLYGRTTVTMRHANHQGIVASFIAVSPTRDEMDWEMTTNDKKNAQTNYYFHWDGETPLYDYGKNSKVSKDFTTADWHAYTIDWSPTEMVFEIDGKPVRTVKRSSTKNKKGAYDYPATPSRIQISIWSSDGMAKGTQEWTGGKPDWSKADSNNEFTAEVKSLVIKCDDPDLHKDYSAYAFSSKMDSTTGQPKIIGTKKSAIVN